MIDPAFARLQNVKQELLNMLEDVAKKGAPAADLLAAKLARVLRIADGLEERQ